MCCNETETQAQKTFWVLTKKMERPQQNALDKNCFY